MRPSSSPWRSPGLPAVSAGAIMAVLLAGCGKSGPQPSADLAASDAITVDSRKLFDKKEGIDNITTYRIRIATDPLNAGLHNNLGNEYVYQNHMDEAIAEFREAAKLDPASPVPWNNLGTTYKKLGKPGDAKSAFNKALEIDPRYALAWYNLGTVHDQEGDYEKAIALYLEALALDPRMAEVATNPQVVENRNLMVVKLRHFLEESGNIALPLDKLPE